MPPPFHHNFASSSSTSSLASNATATAPPITFTLPSIESLQQTQPYLDTYSDTDRLSWAQDALRILSRLKPASPTTADLAQYDQSSSFSLPRIPAALKPILESALPIIISYTTHPDPKISSKASYLKAQLLSTGSCPEYLPRDARQAFKEFESAARGGEVRGWFRLGRDYESVGDLGRARDCFERGKNKGDCECTYRLGMAYLLGQLRLSPDPFTALPLLRTASEISTIDFPQPAYLYGMLLSSELTLPSPIPPTLILPLDSPPSQRYTNQQTTAFESISRAAYLCHPPAQYKLGFLYEHASLNCAYDPLMSVQWYSLASQGGEVEADMALSKWFLCGAEGCFGKNEELARTFAERSARKGHPNGCFAMGYYFELGIGGRKDTDQAKKWYQKAAKLGNTDAISRLQALSAPNPHLITPQEHQSRLNDTLVRTRTQAKNRSNQTRPLDRRRPHQASRPIDPRTAPGVAAAAIMSPNPRVGEIMSPGPGYQFQNMMMPTSGSFPSRPPIPHHAFSEGGGGGIGSSESSGSLTFPENGNGVRRGSAPNLGTGYGKGGDKGPQTFAEMGFVSKPVQDEGCVIM